MDSRTIEEISNKLCYLVNHSQLIFFPLIYPVLTISNVAFYIPHDIWALNFRIVHGSRGISFVSFLFTGIKDFEHTGSALYILYKS